MSEPQWLEGDDIALGKDVDHDELCFCGSATAAGCRCDG